MSEAASGAAAPAEQQGVSYQITAQYIKDLSFENPRAPQIFAQSSNSPQVQVSVAVSAQQSGEGAFEVVLDLKTEAKVNDGPMFMVELSYAGVVAVTGNVPPEHLGPLLMIEVPRLLFPFARSIMSNAARDGGFPALMLSPVDFIELYRQRLQAAEQQQKPQ